MSGTANVVQGSNVVRGSQPIPLEEGERIRIGTDFETSVAEYGDEEEENTFRMKDPWTGPSTGEFDLPGSITAFLFFQNL